MGQKIDGQFETYPFAELSRHAGRLHRGVAGRALRVVFQPEHSTGRVYAAAGLDILVVVSY